MSAISAKALNSTLGTENFKGFDEIFIETLSSLITAVNPRKVYTLSTILQKDAINETTYISFDGVENINKCRVEISSVYTTGDKGNGEYSGFFNASVRLEGKNRVQITYSNASGMAQNFSVIVTEYN